MGIHRLLKIAYVPVLAVWMWLQKLACGLYSQLAIHSSVVRIEHREG